MEATEVFERGQKFINYSLSIYFTSARGDDQVQVHLEKKRNSMPSLMVSIKINEFQDIIKLKSAMAQTLSFIFSVHVKIRQNVSIKTLKMAPLHFKINVHL